MHNEFRSNRFIPAAERSAHMSRPSPRAADLAASFVCMISHEVMHDPVVCADGHSYERKAIETWLVEHSTNPATGATLQHKTLLPNHALRNSIQEYLERTYAQKHKEEGADVQTERLPAEGLTPQEVDHDGTAPPPPPSPGDGLSGAALRRRRHRRKHLQQQELAPAERATPTIATHAASGTPCPAPHQGGRLQGAVGLDDRSLPIGDDLANHGGQRHRHGLVRRTMMALILWLVLRSWSCWLCGFLCGALLNAYDTSNRALAAVQTMNPQMFIPSYTTR